MPYECGAGLDKKDAARETAGRANWDGRAIWPSAEPVWHTKTRSSRRYGTIGPGRSCRPATRVSGRRASHLAVDRRESSTTCVDMALTKWGARPGQVIRASSGEGSSLEIAPARRASGRLRSRTTFSRREVVVDVRLCSLHRYHETCDGFERPVTRHAGQRSLTDA